jgi:hypothetical protein
MQDARVGGKSQMITAEKASRPFNFLGALIIDYLLDFSANSPLL